jgi:hypothetical protein
MYLYTSSKARLSRAFPPVAMQRATILKGNEGTAILLTRPCARPEGERRNHAWTSCAALGWLNRNGAVPRGGVPWGGVPWGGVPWGGVP